MSRTQSHQMVNEAALSNLRLRSRQTLDNILDAVNKRLVRPLDIVANGSTTISISSSGPYAQIDGSQIAFAPVNDTIFTYAGESLNIATGNFSGSSQDYTPPASTANKFRALLLCVNKTGLVQAVYGSEQTTFNLALQNAPPVLKKTAALGVVIVQTDAASNWKGVYPTDIVYFSSAGGSGSGSGGVGKEPAKGYNLLITDSLDVSATDAASLIDSAYTNALFDAGSGLFRMSCDKTKTISTTGTAYTLSAAPSYTVVAGDIIFNNATGEMRRILSLTSQTVGTLDAAFGTNLVASACMVSQAVWTKDLVNVGSSTELTRPRDFFPNTSISFINLEYGDSVTSGDAVPNYTTLANVVAFPSSQGLQSDIGLPLSNQFGSAYTRPSDPTPVVPLGMPSNTNMQRLFVCYAPNPSNGAVTTGANLIEYDISLYPYATVRTAGILNSAYCYTDGAGNEINCSAPAVVSGRTRITLNWNFATGLFPGTTMGELEVRLDGKILPLEVSGSTLDACWRPVVGSNNQIELDTDYSAFNYSVEIVRKAGIGDVSSVNTLKLNALYDAIVGNALQVSSGSATHTTVQAAIDAVPSDGTILVLKGTYSEVITLNKRVCLLGQGYGSNIAGVITCGTNCDYSTVKNLRFNQIVLQAGADGNIVSGCFWVTTPSDLGTGNDINGILI